MFYKNELCLLPFPHHSWRSSVYNCKKRLVKAWEPCSSQRSGVHPELKRGLGVSFWTGTPIGNPVSRTVTIRLQTCSLSATSAPLSNFNPIPSSFSLPFFLLNSGETSHLVFCKFLCTISREREGKQKFKIGGGLWKLVLKGQGDETFLGAGGQ